MHGTCDADALKVYELRLSRVYDNIFIKKIKIDIYIYIHIYLHNMHNQILYNTKPFGSFKFHMRW